MTSQQDIRNATTCDSISGIALYDMLRCARLEPATAARTPTTPLARGFRTPLFAGIYKRSVAAVIDFALVIVASGVIGFGLGCVVAFSPGAFSLALEYAWLLGIVITWLYFSLLESSPSQATIGQRAMGIVITDSRGRRISFTRATLRYFASAIAIFGSVLVLFTRRRQALYDLMAGCVVVETMASARMLRTDRGGILTT